MWTDIETKKDYLNYFEVADSVSEILLNPKMRPVSVGIFGTWGTGKSSLLNLIEENLLSKVKDQVIVIRFDAWLYQGYDDARASLMDVIARTLYEEAKKDKGLVGVAKSFLERVNTMRTLGLAVEVVAAMHGLPMFGAGAKAVKAVDNFIKAVPEEEDTKAIAEAGKAVAGLLDPKKQTSPPAEIDAFRSEFSTLLNGLDKTLVVFVDNLDRCLPQQTIHTLEALRLFLFMDRSAFVIAADEDMVRQSVSHHFKGASERHITDYLDKLIQVPVRVPRLGVAEIRAYLFMLFAEAEGIGERKLDELRLELEGNLRRSWKEPPIPVESVLKVIGESSQALRESLEVADRMATLLATSSAVRGNPRIVKRMLNVVRLRARIASSREMPVNEEMVTKFALYERCVEPDAVNKLYSLINEAPSGKPQLIAELEQLTDDFDKFKEHCPQEWKTNATFLHDWLSIKPYLGGLDLRPLVYLSRETATLRVQSAELSQLSAEAVKRLVNVKTRASPTAKSAIESIPIGEHAGVMKELIAGMRLHTDWNSRPEMFIGAVLLANANADAASLLSSFLTSLPGKPPAWLTAAIRDEKWIGEKG